MPSCSSSLCDHRSWHFELLGILENMDFWATFDHVRRHLLTHHILDPMTHRLQYDLRRDRPWWAMAGRWGPPWNAEAVLGDPLPNILHESTKPRMKRGFSYISSSCRRMWRTKRAQSCDWAPTGTTLKSLAARVGSKSWSKVPIVQLNLLTVHRPLSTGRHRHLWKTPLRRSLGSSVWLSQSENHGARSIHS